MPTMCNEEIEFDQEEMGAIVRSILLGGQELKQAQVSLALPVGGTVTGSPAHWTVNNRGRVESFVLVCDRYFGTTSSQKVQYFAVLKDSDGQWIIPNAKAVVLNKGRGMPEHYSELVRRGLLPNT